MPDRTIDKRDIVERLRLPWTSGKPKEMDEAADEIERLRAALLRCKTHSAMGLLDTCTYEVDATAPELGIDVTIHSIDGALTNPGGERARGSSSTLTHAICLAYLAATEPSP